MLRRRAIFGGGGELPVGTTYEFNYTGGAQTVTLDKGQWKLEVYGAQGGYRSSSTYGGLGGYAVGTLTVKNTLNCIVQVGGSGNTGGTSGGYNGGGSRSTYAGGGGGTDVRIGQNSLYARVIVAGGGGSDGASRKPGKSGGGTEGGSATESYGSGGGGGTQTSGGSGNAGSFGQGGYGAAGNGGYAGAGGGGWYGGGGSNPDSSGDDDRGGGGGSGYVYTSATAGNYPSGCLLDSTYYLTDTSMSSGQRSGNGYCKITKVGGGKPMTVTKYLKSKGYQTCEYVESSGTQYINTGIVPDSTLYFNSRIYIANNIPSTDYTLFGTINYPYRCHFGWVWPGFGGSGDYVAREYTYGGIVIEYSFNPGTRTITENGSTYTISGSGTTMPSYPCYLFARNNRGSADCHIPARIYKFEIGNSGGKVRNYYPVYNISTGAIGLYDLVSDSFFGNNGSGTFTKGADVTISDPV